MSELRRYPRIEFGGVVFIAWKTFDGQRNHVLGRAIDVSERGIGVAVAIRIPVGSFVKVRAYGLNLDGSATVRRVGRLPGGYVLGLELSESLDQDMLAELGASPAEARATADRPLTGAGSRR
jgi:hypothetical protein